jgi:putative acetyltransferase
VQGDSTQFVELRQERAGDEGAIDDVHASAFSRGPATAPSAEATLVRSLRSSSAWIPELSIVAVEDGAIVGHVVCTRAWIDPTGFEAVGLGPLGVRPGRQSRGIGSALVEAVIARAAAAGEAIVGVLGDPSYYARFGFRPSRTLSIAPPDPGWGDNFQAVRLTDTREVPSGSFRYAAAFDEI